MFIGTVLGTWRTVPYSKMGHAHHAFRTEMVSPDLVCISAQQVL
jgi:hypothetical protein